MYLVKQSQGTKVSCNVHKVDIYPFRANILIFGSKVSFDRPKFQLIDVDARLVFRKDLKQDSGLVMSSFRLQLNVTAGLNITTQTILLTNLIYKSNQGTNTSSTAAARCGIKQFPGAASQIRLLIAIWCHVL